MEQEISWRETENSHLFKYRVPVTDDYDWYRPVSGRRHLPICNTHSAFGVGTYYVGVRANNFFNVYNRYKVRVVTQSTGTCPTARTMPSIPDGKSTCLIILGVARFSIFSKVSNFGSSLRKFSRLSNRNNVAHLNELMHWNSYDWIRLSCLVPVASRRSSCKPICPTWRVSLLRLQCRDCVHSIRCFCAQEHQSCRWRGSIRFNAESRHWFPSQSRLQKWLVVELGRRRLDHFLSLLGNCSMDHFYGCNCLWFGDWLWYCCHYAWVI